MEPLDKADLDMLNTALKALESAKEQLKRARAAGIDVTTREERVRVLDERVLQLKRSFFPTGRATK